MRLPLTYRSALTLIGAHEPVLLTRLDKLLGGMILASGVAGLPMGSAVLTAVWGWVDQKSEFVKLLTGGVTWCRDRLAGASGHERRQLVAAAHTVLVGEALFHALQSHLGSAYRSLELTDEEKKHLFRDKYDAQRYGDAVAALLDSTIEVPWAGRTFDENLADSVEPYLRDAISRCLRSFGKLAVWERAWTAYPRPDVNAILRTALGRYEENYFRLATDVPEFLVWALLGDQRGASLAVRAANREIVAALPSQAHSLHKVEALLSLISGTGGRDRDRKALRKLSESILDQPLISASELIGVAEVAIPTIRDGYVAPRFRCALVDSYSHPSSEEWWSTHRVSSTSTPSSRRISRPPSARSGRWWCSGIPAPASRCSPRSSPPACRPPPSRPSSFRCGASATRARRSTSRSSRSSTRAPTPAPSGRRSETPGPAAPAAPPGSSCWTGWTS